MATVSTRIAAAPAAVFAVLAEGWFYSGWVVGTSHVRAVEAAWPEAGSTLFHASGLWPVVTRDVTTVDRVEPDRLLVMTASGRPFGKARVTITLTAVAGGTDVTMAEEPIAGLGKWLHNRAANAVLARRNTEALARLTALVQRHTRPAD